MESTTYLKNLRVSPKKLRFFLTALKKRKPVVALEYLYYAPEKAGKVLYQALKSALANAKNTLKVDESLLEWKLLTIEEGQKLKRYKPGGRGTAKPFKIRFSHIKVVLKAKSSDQIQKKELSVPKVKNSVAKVEESKEKKAEDKKIEDKRVYDAKEEIKVTKSKS